MEVSDIENARVPTRPLGFRAGGGPTEGSKAGPPDAVASNRRALRDIRNIVGAPPYPCAISKRGFTGKNVADDKNKLPPCAAHRPITRRFAATLKSQSGPQSSIPSSGHSSSATWENPAAIVIDVDDYKSADDSPLPMADEIEEAMDFGHKEVEMEDLAVEEPVADIDGCDRRNPLAVVEYLDDIYAFYRKTEASGCVSPNYMSTQFDVNEKMRAILIDWLIEVHYKFELMDETLFLTVNIIDRFLSRHAVVRKKLQLVGVTSMLLACKYEEVSVPVVEDLILISDRAYTKKEVLDMEKLIVNTLQFNMSVPTPYVFMRRFLKAAQSDKKLELMSSFMIELALVEYEMLEFQPSMLAAAAIYTAQCALSGFGSWTKTSEVYTTYTEEQLLECSRKIVSFHRNAGAGKLTGVHRKYSTFKFGFAAKCEPALFLLDRRA